MDRSGHRLEGKLPPFGLPAAALALNITRHASNNLGDSRKFLCQANKLVRQFACGCRLSIFSASGRSLRIHHCHLWEGGLIGVCLQRADRSGAASRTPSGSFVSSCSQVPRPRADLLTGANHDPGRRGGQEQVRESEGSRSPPGGRSRSRGPSGYGRASGPARCRWSDRTVWPMRASLPGPR